MEPEGLTPDHPDDVRLEALLRASAPQELPDNGFSARVLAELPLEEPEGAWWRRRNTFLVAGAVAGFAVVLASGGTRPAVATINTSLAGALSSLAGILSQTGVMLALAGIATAYVL